MIRDIQSLDGGRLVRMTPWLLGYQPESAHETSDLEPAYLIPFFAHRSHYGSATSGASTLIKQLIYLAPQHHLFGVNMLPATPGIIVTGSGDTERFTDQFNRLMLELD
jgi:hypothetical protein